MAHEPTLERSMESLPWKAEINAGFGLCGPANTEGLQLVDSWWTRMASGHSMWAASGLWGIGGHTTSRC